MLDLDASAAWRRASAALVLILASWFIVLLAENARVPFDDPNTHLELTMIHEVMVLDHAGPAFGFILYGAALKLSVFATPDRDAPRPVALGLGGARPRAFRRRASSASASSSASWSRAWRASGSSASRSFSSRRRSSRDSPSSWC